MSKIYDFIKDYGMQEGIYFAYVDHTEMIGEGPILTPIVYVRSGQKWQEGFTLEANLPSTMSITTIGSYQRSMPLDNTPCLIYVPHAHLCEAQKPTILTFLPEYNNVTQGKHGNRDLAPGGYEICTGGGSASRFSMQANSVELGTALDKILLTLDGVDLKTSLNTKQFIMSSSGGGFEYRDIITSSETSKDICYHIEVYRKAPELLGAHDADLALTGIGALGKYECESSGSIDDPIDQLGYQDKVIIQAGQIINRNITSQSIWPAGTRKLSHVYQLETRQAVSIPNIKDTFTCLRLGYQDGNALYKSGVFEPKGTIIDWRAKHVKTPMPAGMSLGYESFVMRFGKIDKFTPPALSDVSNLGELYRLQITENNIEKSGEGLGYESKLNKDMSGQQYCESFGLLSDGSFYTKHIHNKLLSMTETLNTLTYKLNLSSLAYNINTQHGSIIIGATGIIIDCPLSSIKIKNKAGSIEISEEGIVKINSGGLLASLVTKDWVDFEFKSHMHNTTMGGPTVGTPWAVTPALNPYTKTQIS